MRKLMNFSLGFGLPTVIPVFDNDGELSSVDYIDPDAPRTGLVPDSKLATGRSKINICLCKLELLNLLTSASDWHNL
jgi:hypothetical protein